MNLTPREKDKLLISMAAMVARRRLERGVKLNHPEAIALITDFVIEGARDGRPDTLPPGGALGGPSEVPWERPRLTRVEQNAREKKVKCNAVTRLRQQFTINNGRS